MIVKQRTITGLDNRAAESFKMTEDCRVQVCTDCKASVIVSCYTDNLMR